MKLLTSLIACLILVLNVTLAETQPAPEQTEASVQDRKSAWKLHAVSGKRPLYRRGGEILVQYQSGASREVLNTSALAPMIQGIRTSRGDMEAVMFDEGTVDFSTLREQLLATAGVLHVEPNVLLSTQNDVTRYVGGDLSSNQWHLEKTTGHSRLIGLSRTPLPTGQAIRVGVIDTGVDYAHEEFAGRTIAGVNLISHPLPDEDPKSEVDLNGHGTRVAGIIAAADDDTGVLGINPRAEICSIKVFNRDGDGYLGDIIAGIDWAIDHRIQVLNMSFGTYQYSELLADAISRALDAGILLIAAAGNDAAETAMYPAAFPGVLSVGAYDKRGQTSAFSILPLHHVPRDLGRHRLRHRGRFPVDGTRNIGGCRSRPPPRERRCPRQRVPRTATRPLAERQADHVPPARRTILGAVDCLVQDRSIDLQERRQRLHHL